MMTPGERRAREHACETNPGSCESCAHSACRELCTACVPTPGAAEIMLARDEWLDVVDALDDAGELHGRARALASKLRQVLPAGWGLGT